MVGIRAVAGARLHSSGHVSTRATESPSELLPRVHRVISLLKRWLLGTHQGAMGHHHLDDYLDEFTFRFNRLRLPRAANCSIAWPSRLCRSIRPVCNPGQTTTYCVRWREVNTPILRYSSVITKQKALVKYILVKIYEANSPSLAIDPNKMTLEHLSPENPSKGGLSTEELASIGNLILVTQDQQQACK